MTPEQQELLDKYDELTIAFVAWIGLPMRSPSAEIALGTYQRLSAEIQQNYDGEYRRK